MKLKIVPYKMSSDSAQLLQKKLSDKMGYYVWRGKPVADRKLIFWGRKPDKIGNFKLLLKAKVPHVPFTTDRQVALQWQKEGAIIFARTPGGQKGVNIDVVQPHQELPDRPLYTRYVKNYTEFRVNVAYGEAIHVSQKRRENVANVNPYIRSADGGWGFRKPLFEPNGLRQIAVDAAKAVGLDFAGVDVIYNKFYDRLYVLEVNSAPWLNDNIADKYAAKIAENVQP